MPSERASLHRALRHAERDLDGIQLVVLVLLAILLGYAGWLVYIQDWKELLALLPSTTAACAAMLVAKTATRLLTYNMLVRADDRTRSRPWHPSFHGRDQRLARPCPIREDRAN